MNFSVLQSGSWKTVKDYYIRQSSSWKKIKKAYVRQGGTWKLYYSTPVTITITPDTISNSENGTTIANPENYNFDYSITWDGTQCQPVYNYSGKKIWYNLNLANILSTLGLTDAIYSQRELIVVLNNAYIGGKHGNLANNGSTYYVDCALRKQYAFDMRGVTGNFTAITLKAIGDCKIQGFGGLAVERNWGIDTHGNSWQAFRPINEGVAPGWPSYNNAMPFKDYFSADTTYRKNDSGWRAYTDEDRINAMRIAQKYFNITAYHPDFNPNNIGEWNRYKDIISNDNVLFDLVPFSMDTNEFPQCYINPYVAAHKNRQQAPGYNGGHALIIDRPLTIKTDPGAVLKIHAGAGGGQGYNRNRVTYGSNGGRGLPGGMGALAGYVHKHDGRDESSDYDEQLRRNGSLNGENEAPFDNSVKLKYGRYTNITSDSNLNLRFYDMYGVLASYDGTTVNTPSRDFYTNGSVSPICLVGNLHQTLLDLAYSLSVSTPGLAINYNGQSINTSGANVNIIGPELLSGDGLSYGNWKR